MRKKLSRNFYTQPTLKIAKELLGKYIVRPVRKSLISNGVKKIVTEKIAGKIIETEAYVGPQDKAAHSYKGRITPRNKVEYLIGGHIYIYLVYGMYWQLNITTAGAGEPECVLIRAIKPELRDSQGTVKGLSLANGPGKVCRYLKLDKSFYGEDLTKSKKIWLENRGEETKDSQVLTTGRIGIDYAGPYWSRRKWRFIIKEYRKYLPK